LILAYLCKVYGTLSVNSKVFYLVPIVAAAHLEICACLFGNFLLLVWLFLIACLVIFCCLFGDLFKIYCHH
jgi:hypothetical protein